MTRFDLHIHTALSACAEDVMSPRQVLSRASAAGLTLVAITDHNASAHVPVALELAEEYGVAVIPGMELTTKEEAHVLVFFPKCETLRDFQNLVDRSLSADPNLPEVFGQQIVYDAADEIVDVDERLRQVGTSLGLEQVTGEVKARGGVLVPAHITRSRNSLTSQLGFVDAAGGFDAVEVERTRWNKEGFRLGTRVEGYPAITGSDAHFLEDIGRTILDLPDAVSDLRGWIRAVRQAGERA